MLKQTGFTDMQSERTIIITRIFNAPRELVFKVWTEPKHIEQWWGPEGFTTRVVEMDLRPLGQLHYVIVGPDGAEHPVKGVCREIVPPERIVTSDEFEAGIEKVLDADLPQGMVMTVTFEELEGKTRVTIQIVHESADDRRKHEKMGVVTGWNSSLDCLNQHLTTLLNPHQLNMHQSGLTVTLPSDREIVVTRVFNAPRRLVFEAWTQPEHVKRWFGGCGNMTMTVCEVDLRVGGSWRYVLHDSRSGTEHAFSGEYREIVPPERLVATERYEPIPNSDHVNTLTLTEADGKTALHIHVLYQSAEHRDGHLQSGMETGMRTTFDRLEELIQSLK